LMEYIIMTFFIFIVIIVLIFFLIGYQITQFSLEQRKGAIDRTLSILKQVSVSPLLVKEEGVFDDAKLTALAILGSNGCESLRRLLGEDWFFEVRVLDSSNTINQCDASNYPSCNYWSFCQENRNFTAFDLPVNVYRNTGIIVPTGILPRIDIAILKVGVYEN